MFFKLEQHHQPSSVAALNSVDVGLPLTSGPACEAGHAETAPPFQEKKPMEMQGVITKEEGKAPESGSDLASLPKEPGPRKSESRSDRSTHPASSEKSPAKCQENVPVVANRFADNQLREIASRLRERTKTFKEKVIDPYASSPEHSPPVIMRKSDFLRIKDKKSIKEEELKKRNKEEAKEMAKEKGDNKKRVIDDNEDEEEDKEEAEVKPDLSTCSATGFTCLLSGILTVVNMVIKPVEERLDTWLDKTIDPFTDHRYMAWLGVSALAFIYNMWLIPARITFPWHSMQSIPFWFCSDLLADTIYIIDMVAFQPRLQFVKDGDVVRDFIAVMPFELLYTQFGFTSVLRTNRILKVQSFFEFSNRLESITNRAYIWRVMRTTGYLLFILHINACLYYTASDFEGIGSSDWVYDGKGNAYLRSFLYAEKSLLMVAELPLPDTLFGQVFQMTNYFFGAFFLSTFLAQMGDVIGAASAAQTHFQTSMDNTVAYMNTYKIPRLVQNRVRTWYNYTWDSQGMLDEFELLDKMPLIMRKAIAVDINLSTFQKIDLFKGCEDQMLVDVLLRLNSVVYLPGDFVCKKGDIGKEMYIIKAGAVQVVGGPDNKTVFVTLKAGCVFGEISLLQSSSDGGNRRTANVVAQGFANLLFLEKKDLNDILVNYPESQKLLARKGRKLMKAKGLITSATEGEEKKEKHLFTSRTPTP